MKSTTRSTGQGSDHIPDVVWDRKDPLKLRCKTCGNRVYGMGTTIQPWRHA